MRPSAAPRPFRSRPPHSRPRSIRSLTQWCSRCHAPTALTPQQPYFASADINEAYSNAQAKIDLADANPTNATPPVPCTVTATATTCLSRFVARLATDHHNCWSDCTTDAQAMLTAIENFANPIPLTTGGSDAGHLQGADHV